MGSSDAAVSGVWTSGNPHSVMRLGNIPPRLRGELALCRRSSDEYMGILQLGLLGDTAEKIYNHMTAEGFEVQRSPIPDTGSWDHIFDTHEIDVLVAGDYPDNIDACMDFAWRVIRRNPLIDVLLYGVGNIEPRAVPYRSVYTKVWISPDSDYSDQAIKMILMHRQKWNDEIFLRGMVVSQIVELEGLINDALAAHFRMDGVKSDRRQFTEYILENPLYLLEGKKQTLKKILGEVGLKNMWRGMDNKISDLQSKRNKIAHCEVEPTDITIIKSMDNEYRYDREAMRKILKNARLVRENLLNIIESLQERRR